jgi:hypothetical protein
MMDNDREGSTIGPSVEHLPDTAVTRLTHVMFRDIMASLLMSFPGEEYDDIPWQFREAGTNALAMYDPA